MPSTTLILAYFKTVWMSRVKFLVRPVKNRDNVGCAMPADRASELTETPFFARYSFRAVLAIKAWRECGRAFLGIICRL